MTSQWQPYREPLRITMLRTGMIAIVVGAVLAQLWGGLGRWPMATLLVLLGDQASITGSDSTARAHAIATGEDRRRWAGSGPFLYNCGTRIFAGFAFTCRYCWMGFGIG